MADRVNIKFSVGYQLIEEEKIFLDIVKKFKKRIDEVYFPWLNLPTGRGPIATKNGYINWDAQKQIEYELKGIKKIGIKLNLLLNASCWGEFSLSTTLANNILSIIEYLGENIGLDSITVYSPVVAYIIKKHFSEIEIRSSVNMRIGTINAMEQISELFDGFVIQREFNRDFEKIAELKNWCNKNSKKLSILANSGCVNFCPVQMFHDNIIAHEIEIFTKNNITDNIPGNCWDYYKKRENWKNLIMYHSWIRPEDIALYKNYVSTIKLATRINPEPEKIIKAYAKKKFDGNLLDILEPSHSNLLFPFIIDNSRFPKNWFKKVVSCKTNCKECCVCFDIFEKVLVKIKK